MDGCFYRAMREKVYQNSKEGMLNYLISLLDDANDFSWPAAKACHAVRLCRMEQGETRDYTQVDQIDRVIRMQGIVGKTLNTLPNLVPNGGGGGVYEIDTMPIL